jgi:hypothetical protein
MAGPSSLVVRFSFLRTAVEELAHRQHGKVFQNIRTGDVATVGIKS